MFKIETESSLMGTLCMYRQCYNVTDVVRITLTRNGHMFNDKRTQSLNSITD